MKLRLISLLSVLVLLSSCAELKPYERQYVDDAEMQVGTDSGQQFLNYVYSIREGATPTENTKGSGGCGCN